VKNPIQGEGRAEATAPALHLVPKPDAEVAHDELAISASAMPRWNRLAEEERASVGAFLDGEIAADGAYLVTASARLPREFVADLSAGGPLLRAAFPDLARKVSRVETVGEETVVRVRCLGDHRGPFYRLLSATGKEAGFDVVHRFVHHAEGRCEDRVAVDVRAIVTQLAEHRAKSRATAKAP